MEKKSVKILTKLFCIASVVAVLFLCACPAFALGEQYGNNRYSAMPFDYLVVSGYGGQIDYMGRFSRVGTQLTSYIRGFPDSRQAVANVVCTNNDLICDYTFNFVPASGAINTTSVSLYAENTYMQLLTNGLKVQIGSTLYDGDSIPDWFTVTSVIVEGVVAGFDGADGDVYPHDYAFSQHFTNMNYSNMSEIDIPDLIRIALRVSDVPVITAEHGYLFERLSVRFYVRKNLDFGEYVVKFTNTSNGLYTEPLSTQNWVFTYINNNVDIGQRPPSEPNVLDVSTFLGDSVSAFMDVEIFPGFTLGTLFGIALTIGVLFFGLKMLV